jgi:hypothetical protein
MTLLSCERKQQKEVYQTTESFRTLVSELTFKAEDESPCHPQAGRQIRMGTDSSRDGKLDESEINSIALECEESILRPDSETYEVEDTVVPVPPIPTGCKGLTRTVDFVLSFSQLSSCGFGIGDNLNSLPDRVRAMRENRKTVSIANANFCDLTIQIENLRFAYDDHMFLLLNERLLHASSDAWNSFFFVKDSFRIFDFLSIRNQPGPVESEVVSPFCIKEASKCELGSPALGGAWRFVLSSGALPIEAWNVNSVDLAVVVIGDNDLGDCAHSSFEATVKITYY